MFPSSSMGQPGTSNSATGPSKRSPGVRIPMEGHSDWNLKFISYDGSEKYVAPLEYEDELQDRAFLINWRQILGSELEYDSDLLDGQGSHLIEEDNDDYLPARKDEAVPPEQMVVPDAGPWHTVAKNLHESLLQMNVFLDNLNVLRKTHYVAALTILDPNQSEPQSDLPNQNRAAQWVWKRKALQDAGNVLEMSIKRMDQSGVETKDDQDFKNRTQFFHELRKMREYWRIRKTGDHITGDLGYKIFGQKYNSREIFDISRRSEAKLYLNSDRSRVANPVQNETLCQSILQVTVPRDLARRATLSVSVIPDDKTSTGLFPDLDDLHFEYIRLDAKNQEQIHWDNALKWAQETLICRETFKTLCKEAASMHLKRTIIRDGVLISSLNDDLMIRIELKYFPFEELPPSIQDGDPLLNRALRQMLVAEQCFRTFRPQVFVSLPLTHLSEQLDFRGPKAFSQQEIEDRRARPCKYMTKISAVASHYTLVKTVVSALKEVIKEDLDPALSFRFIRCTQTSSLILCSLYNKYYDHIMSRINFYIRITTDDVTLVAASTGQDIHCYRDRSIMVWGMHQMMTNYALQSIISLAKTHWWYLLVHCNINNLDEHGNFAPTILLYNDVSTRSIFIKFFMDRSPEIQVKKLSAIDDHFIKFVSIDYNGLPGTSMIRKFDSLFALFRESEICKPIEDV